MGQQPIVVDTSVIVKWLSQDNEDHIEEANKLLKDVQLGKITIVAPELAKYEVGNVLLYAKKLSMKQAETVLAQLYKLPISFVEDSLALAGATFKLAVEAKITYYDASFMVLAQQYDAELITDNVKHQDGSEEVKVRAIEDY